MNQFQHHASIMAYSSRGISWGLLMSTVWMLIDGQLWIPIWRIGVLSRIVFLAASWWQLCSLIPSARDRTHDLRTTLVSTPPSELPCRPSVHKTCCNDTIRSHNLSVYRFEPKNRKINLQWQSNRKHQRVAMIGLFAIPIWALASCCDPTFSWFVRHLLMSSYDCMWAVYKLLQWALTTWFFSSHVKLSPCLLKWRALAELNGKSSIL